VTVLYLLNLAARMDSSQECTLRETARTLCFVFWYSYRSQYGGQRYGIGSQSCDRIRKFLLSNLLGEWEIKRQPVGN